MNNFPKSEKLCGQLRIKALYSDGTRFVVWPLRVTYKLLNAPEAQLNSEALNVAQQQLNAPQVLIWAPKSLFKHAVDRNRMRRVMREAYRLNKAPLEGMNMQIAFNYIDKQQQPYAIVEKAMRKAIKRIANENDVA